VTLFIQVYEKPILPLIEVPKPGLLFQIIKFALLFLVIGEILLMGTYLTAELNKNLKN
jgi:hypothetical protein